MKQYCFIHFKNYKSRKPDSVSTLSFICDKHYCLPVAAYPGPRPLTGGIESGLLSNEPIRGITAPKVYPYIALLQNIVSSYLTFSPLPAGGYFLWHFLLLQRNTRLFTGGLPFAVRTFLPALNAKR